jgi:hypothetical protein
MHLNAVLHIVVLTKMSTPQAMDISGSFFIFSVSISKPEKKTK